MLRRSKESNKQKGEHQISQKFTAIERHRAATDREDRAIVRLVKTHPDISARETKERLNLNVAEETIRNRLKQICSGESPEISRILTSATEKSVWNLGEGMWTSGKNFGVVFYELTSPTLKCEVKTQKEQMFGENPIRL